MANDWKYAALGQNERLDLIKSGNQDVYNAEKKRNASLKKLKTSLGISTQDVDDWDSLIDSAREMSTQTSLLTKTDIDALSGTPAKRASYLLNSELDQIQKDLNLSKTNAVEEAEDELELLAEWLASNGYSIKGKKARESKEKMIDELAREIQNLEGKYRQKALQTLSSSISKFG